MTEYWGYHLILDCGNLQCDNHFLNNKSYIKAFVKEVLDASRMTAWGDVIIERLQDCTDELSGYTVVQLLHTSNMCMHICDKLNTLYFDLFSCKSFPEEQVISVIKKYFDPKSIRKTFLTRQA